MESVELRALEVSSFDKFDALSHLLRKEKGRTLVFARTKRGTERLATHLERDGFLSGHVLLSAPLPLTLSSSEIQLHNSQLARETPAERRRFEVLL